jgi:Radical SAM superfamily
VRLLLFFPPQCRPFHAHLSLAILKAEACRRGHECRVVDLNLRFYRHVLSQTTLVPVVERIASEAADLDARPELAGPDAVRLARLASALIRSQYVLDHVDAARSVLKSEEFYDYGRLQWAVRVLEDALELFSSAYGSTDIGLSQLRTRYATGSSADLWQGSVDATENPFVGLLGEWAHEEIAQFQPDVIGISIGLDEQLLPSFALARQLRELWSGTLVAGGSMVTRLRDALPGNQSFGRLFDHYLPYEAEAALGDILDRLAGGPVTPPVPFSELVPDFDDLVLDDYLLPERVLPYQSSRGCSYGRCHYCSHYKTYDRFVLGDPGKAAEHLAYLTEHHDCRNYYFVDEEMMPRFGLDLADALTRAGLDIRWMVFGRLHQHWSAEVARRFAEAGCRRLIFGLDSGSARIQEAMGKRTDLDYAGQILRWCAEAGIAIQVNLITGFPGETAEEAIESLDFVVRHRDAFNTLGSNTAIANFALVRDAGWDQMPMMPVHESDRDFAMYYSYRTTAGLRMADTPALADRLQREADRSLDASRRWPALREFAFLYRERYGARAVPPKSTEAPPDSHRVFWFSHNIRLLLQRLSKARDELPVAPIDHQSVWWRLSQHAEITSTRSEGLYGYRVAPQYDGTGFQVALVDAVDLDALLGAAGPAA